MAHNILDTLPFPIGTTAGSKVTYSSPDGSGARISPMPSSPLYDTDGTSAQANNTANKITTPTFFRGDLAGKRYSILSQITDPNITGSLAGQITEEPVTLRAVQNGTGAALVISVIGQTMQFDTAHGRNGVVVSSKTGSAGKMSKPAHDAYPAGFSVPAGDWFYVVEEGPCLVTTSGSPSNGSEAKADGSGNFTTATQASVACGVFRSCYNTGNQAILDVTYGITPVQTYG